MAEPEDLEYNKFFSLLQQKFPRLYERALESCFLICVPHSSFVSSSFKPTQTIYERHILQPSPYLKNEFESLCKPPIKVHLGEGVLTATLPLSGTSHEVKIISTELYYNSSRQKCSVLSIEGFLDTPASKIAATQKVGNEDFFQSRSTYEENATFVRSYLGSMLPKLKEQARFFNEGYHIVRGKLHHLVEHLMNIRDELVAVCARSPTLAEVRGDPRLPSVMAEAVEIELLHSVGDKIFQAVARENEKQDEELALALKKTATLPQQAFGITFLPGTLDFQAAAATLRSVAREKAPSLKFIMLRNTITFVSEEAKRCASPGFVLAADEMLPLLSMAVARAGCADLLSQLAYTEQFGFTPSAASSEFSYVLTTLQAAITHLLHLAAPLPLPLSPPASTTPTTPSLSSSSASVLAGMSLGGGAGILGGGSSTGLGLVRASSSFGSSATFGGLSSSLSHQQHQSTPALNFSPLTAPLAGTAATYTPLSAHSRPSFSSLHHDRDLSEQENDPTRPYSSTPHHSSSHSQYATPSAAAAAAARELDQLSLSESSGLPHTTTPPSMRAAGSGRAPGLLSGQSAAGSSINLRPLSTPATLSKEQNNSFFLMHMLGPGAT